MWSPTPSTARHASAWRAVGCLVGGVALDATLGDPTRGHPVAVFGTAATMLERVLRRGGSPRGLRVRGVAYTAVLVGGAAGAVAAVDVALARHPMARTAWGAAVVWSCLGGTSLFGVAGRHAELLRAGDVPASRTLLPWLCGRDPSALGDEDLARAVVESVAENTSDAVVATLVWAGLGGPAAAAAHRAANTLDALVGHPDRTYRDFGWAAARLDDLLGWPGARVTGLLTVICAPVVGGRPAAAMRAWRRDAPAHPSPNAGVVEATAAGALGVRLGGPTPYPYGVQDRARLGRGRQVAVGDIRRAVRLERAVHLSAAAVAVGCAVTVRRRRGEPLGRRRARGPLSRRRVGRAA